MDFKTIIIQVIAVTFAIVVHEFAHGFVAMLFGDNSAKNEGRLSLNPFKHLDPLGVMSLFIFKFGWAKPVPVNSNNLKNYNIGMFFVSIAGIATNFLFAFIFGKILKYASINSTFIIDLLVYLMIINLNLAVFNLIPIPPLDGSNILLSFFSRRTAYEVSKYSRYSSLVLLILIVSGSVSKIMNLVIWPIFEWILK